MKFSGVTILQGVEFFIFLLILNGPYNSAALLRCLWWWMYTIICSASTVHRYTSEDYQRLWASSWCRRCCQFAPVDCISRLSGFVELRLRYTTPGVHCIHMRYECDGGIKVSIALIIKRCTSVLFTVGLIEPLYWAQRKTISRIISVSALSIWNLART